MKRLSLLLAVSLLFICQVSRSQTLPSGFSTTTIGSGWNLPLGTAFTNDGQKMFVWEKDGRVYVCNRNTAGAYIKQTTPVLDISEEVANWGDHGLMGFALDPDYLSNGLIYLLYVVDRHHLINFGTPAYNPATSSGGATIGRITRYKTTTSGSNTAIDPTSRFILLGETKQTGIAIMHDGHGLGGLAFAADGTLLATAGDAGSYYLVDKGSDNDTDFGQALADGIIRPAENVGAFRAQILNSHNGKLLRIDPVTGNGVSSNPYYSAAQPRSPKSRVWAFGLRNPYRFSIKAGTGSTNPAAGDVGEIFLGDVGWNTYEEVTIVTTPGVNCGWPLYEGLTTQPGYTSAVTANLDEPNPLFGIGGCTKQYFNFQDLIKQVTADNNKTIYNSCNPATAIGTGTRYVHHRPSMDWRHFTNEARVGIFSGNTATTAMVGSAESNVIGTPFPGNCATGGPWYNGTSFPATYQNKYFVADHDGQWIKCFSVDFTDVVTEVKNFGTGFLGTVNINMNPLDGTLAVVELGNFSTIGASIKQIRFGGNQAPIVKMTSDKTFGPSVLNVNFTGNTSSDPDGTIAGYAWNFGDGGTSTSANPSHNFTAPANTPTKYVVKLTVTDNLGATALDSIIISVNNTPPVVNITSPVKNSLYQVGPDTLYTCSATVTDAEHNAAGLKYEWQTFLHHNSHVHPEGISTATSTTTSISRIGCNGDDYYWFIKLTVIDAAGLSTVDSSKIFPDCSPGLDNTPPVVSTVTPLNGATNVTTGTTVSAVFNETIDPVTVTGTTFQLKNAANAVIPAAINTSFNQLTITPSAALTGSTVYTATIKGGSSGVKDLAGNALSTDYSWSFTTVAVDLTPPAVTSVSPQNGATGVSTGTTVTANFNEAINASTVTAATVELRNAGNAIIPATITASSNQIILTPSSPLTGSTIYTATIKGGSSGVKDLSGNALVNDFVWSFTTGAIDVVPPTVVSVLPANAAIGVSTGAAITANFSESVNPSTVTTTTFQLKDASNNIIAATVNTSSNVVTLIPSSALVGSTTYTVTITGGAAGVKDLTGNALAANYSWSFTTVAVIPPALVTIQSFDTKTGVGATVHSLAGIPAGALLVLSTTADALVSDCIVSSVPSLTWTKRVDAGAAQSDNAEIWTAVYTGGGAITVTSNWGAENSETSVCYVVLNAEPILAGAFGTGVLQTAPSVTVNTTRENSILFGCTADWKAINGATRTLRDAATERLYFKDGHYTTYHYAKAATIIAAYTEGVSIPSNQQASTAILEIRGATGATNIIPPTITTQPASQVKCAGTSVSFTSAANGTPVPTVQWQESINGTNWNNIAGAVNSTLSFATTIADNNKQYRAVWTNSAGPVSSNPATLTVNSMAAPVVMVADNCGNSVLTVELIAGTLLWSNGETSSSITVTNSGTYSVVQTVDGCISDAGNGIATPKPIPSAPLITVADNCGSSTLTASGFAGSLLWSTGETTASITVATAGPYTVTQTVNGCISAEGSAIASPKTIPAAPIVTVTNNCGHSVLTAASFTGTLLWSTGETTTTITVTTADTYTVTQTVDGCISDQGSGIAAPIISSVTSPTITVVDNCGSSELTAGAFTGTLLWSTGETTPAITVTAAGTYTLTQTLDGCTSDPANAIAAPKIIPSSPTVTVVDNCGNTVLTAESFTGSLLWNTGETTNSITVSATGTYTVTQTMNGCTSMAGSGTASLKIIPSSPTVIVADNCGNSVLTASDFTGSLLWSTGETTTSISVTTGGTYTVAQIVDGCASALASGIAAPLVVPSAPTVAVTDNCGSSLLTASGYTGSLLWSTGETTESITVTTGGTYTVTQTVGGCISADGNGISTPILIPPAPIVTIANNCGNSLLTASGFTGSLLWSTGETTESITVTNGGTYTVTQTVNGCESAAGSGLAEPINSVVATPTIVFVDDCGQSVLTAEGFTGTLLWSTGETSPSITVANAGTYTVTQTVNGCSSAPASGIATPKIIPGAPTVEVSNNCESSILTASNFTGTLLWSTGETTSFITVTSAGNYTVSQTVDGCTSVAGNGTASPVIKPTAPSIALANNCGHSVLTASGYTGALLWSTGETTESITVTTGGTYTVTQTVNGCTGDAGSGLAEPINSVVATPTIVVVDDCGQSVLTAEGFTGTLLWSTGEITPTITVVNAGTYTVTQTVNGCSSAPAIGIAIPKIIPGAPTVEVSNNCESSILTASNFTGTILWSTGETTVFITVTSAGNYTVSQTVDGCTSAAGNGIAAPVIKPTAPSIAVANNCGHSVLTASGYTGALLWSTGETTESITVTTGGTYTVTQTVNGCTGDAGSGLAEPINSVVATPTIVVVDDCGQSVLTAEGFTGTLLWSTGEITPTITVVNAGTYTVTQTVNGCSSAPASVIATPKIIPGAPTVDVVNNCESSILTASNFTGTILWSTGETTVFITVTSAGNYTVSQTVDGCTSAAGNGIAAPVIKPTAPSVAVANNCGHSVLTASGFTGALLWSTGETTESITVTTGGTYTVTQTVNGCTGVAGSGLAAPVNSVVPPPVISVFDYCGVSALTASGFTGTLLWSTGETISSISVFTAGYYSVIQTIDGCPSIPVNIMADPKPIPAAPIVEVVNNCESSIVTASNFTGSLLWSTTETSTSITVNNAGSYSVTQTVNGCISGEATTTALPKAKPVAPSVSVVNNCGYSVLTASNFTGSLVWSNGATSSSITVNDAGIYTVTQTVNGCISDEGSATAAPFNPVVDPPTISVVNDCTNSILTAESFTGALSWSNGATTPSITVSTPGTYTVTQTVNGCLSPAGSGTAAPLNTTIAMPTVTVVDNCGSSVLTAGSFTGSLLWSNGATTPDITVTAGGTYTVTQTINGCTGSTAGSGVAAPKVIPSAPNVEVINNCGNSVLTVSGFTGTLLWNTGETTSSIIINTEGTYTVTQTVNGCSSEAGSALATPKAIPLAPTVSVVDDCGNSTLTAGSFTGALLWSNAATTTSITINQAATHTVTQTVNGCTSETGTGVAAPKAIPVLSGSLSATAVSGTAFSYIPASITAGTTFAWSRAAVPGISNAAAAGTGTISETLVNTLSTAANVTYVITLTANGCINTQNVVVSVSSVPVVTTVSPANGATGVSINSTITANFSEAINGTTVTATTFQLKDAANTIIPATINTSSSLITLTPSVTLTNSTTYTVTIKGGTSGVKGVAGNAMVNDYVWSFTTVAAPSLPPVTIQSVTTKTGIAATSHPLTGVPAGALLVLATTADAIVSNCVVSSSPALTWTKRVDAGASQSDNAEIWTAVYAAGGTITVNSNWGTDNSQTSVCYVVLNAEPVLGGASAIATLQSAPSVTITTTRENSIIFGCTADWKAINGATRTLRDAATERLYFRDGHYTTYYYTKAAATIAAYTEGVSLPTGQQASTALLEIRSVSGAPDITPPNVTSVSPINGATGVPVNTTVSAIFNETMNAATIGGSTIELRNASNALIAATVSYNSTTRTATVTPSVVLANSTIYTAKVIGGTPGVKDAAGNALTNDYSWSFTTEAGDITPPTVTSVTPVNGATGISISATASAIFNEAMDASTINNSTIELRNSSNALVTATVSYNAATRTATLTPLAALSNSTVYTATIKAGVPGVKDIAGNALAIDYSWSFTTVVADLTPPTVTSVTPLNGATAVSASTAVTAIFNEAMNATTINSSTVELRNASNILITATVSYNVATRTATLTPSNVLANSTLYTAKVISGTSGVKDAAGNALATDYSWSFTTGAVIVQPPVTIQSVTTKTGIAATSHPLTGVPAGALLVLATTADAVVSNCAVSSSPALTWTKRVDAGASQSDNAEIWTAVYTAGGTITVNSNWGTDNSQTSVCYVVLNAEPVLGGASAIATLQSAPSVAITTTRENSIIFGCTADWKAINGATRTLRDAATERLYFSDGYYTTYYYTKAAATIEAYTEGVSLPTGQQASTALLEIRSVATVLTRPANSALPIVNANASSNVLTNSLGQNYPNPVEYETRIPFTISAPEKVKLVLFDMNGRLVKVLVNASKDAGKHVVNFNAGSLAKGIYYYRIEAGEFTDIKKLVIF